MALFWSEDPYIGAPPSIRKSLAAIDLDVMPVKRLISAGRATGVDMEVKTWRGEAWAHIAFPKLKLAIAVRRAFTHEWARDLQAKWEKVGWTFLAVCSRNIDRLTDEQLLAHLKSAIESVTAGKATKGKK